MIIDRREKGIKIKVRMSEEEEGEELGLGGVEKVVCWVLLGVSVVMAVVGTALVYSHSSSSLCCADDTRYRWSFLPIENS